jgi:hypothetical protein
MYNLPFAALAREADRRPHPPSSVLPGLRVSTHADQSMPHGKVTIHCELEVLLKVEINSR